MPDFRDPELPAVVASGFSELSFQADCTLTQAEVAAFGEPDDPEEDTVTAVGVRHIDFDQRKAILIAYLGVRVRGELDPDDTNAHLHIDIHRRYSDSPEEDADGWTEKYELLRRFRPTLVGQVLFRFRLSGGDVTTAITLPISLGAGETPGFTEVSGVRLVQRDSSDAEQELYSVILDRYPDLLAVDVRVPLESPLDAELITRSAERALVIASQAVPSLGGGK